MLPSLALLANMSYQAKAVEIMTAHALDVSDTSCYYDNSCVMQLLDISHT